jgi:hypothetical protein
MRLNISATQRAIRRLRERAPHMVTHAQNRAATSAVTVMSRQVAADTKLRVGVVKDQLRVESATVHRPVARVWAVASRIPLIHFGAKGPEPSRGRGKGVRARTNRALYPGAFIATMRSGHRGVFRRLPVLRSRKGKPRQAPALPIVELFGPSIAHVFVKHIAAGRARYLEQFEKNVLHNFRRYQTAA